MDTKRIGRRVKAFRKLKGFTQIDFAREIDVSVAQLGNIERGTKAASDDLLDQIAKKLSIPREELTLEKSGTETKE